MRKSILFPGRRNSNLTLLLIVLCFSTLNACGKKGALYLPTESGGAERIIKSDPQIITPDDSEDPKESKKKPSAQ